MIGHTLARVIAVGGRTLIARRMVWKAAAGHRFLEGRAPSLHSRQFQTSTTSRDRSMLTPAVLKACQEAVGKLQARGMVPESASKASGMMFMAKLMRDPESVKIITELMETLKKEGVDVSPASMKKMMEEFTNMGANASNFASAQLKEKDNVLQQPSAQNDEEQPQKKTISDYLGGSWFKR